MSLDGLKQQAAQLAPNDRRRLVAYLISLEDAQHSEYAAKLRDKIDDQTPGHSLTIEEMDQRLGTGESSK